MSAYPSEPCPICNEEVTMAPGPRAMHMKRHETEQAKVVEPDLTDYVSDLDKIKDPATRSLYEKALKAQARRKKAPEMFLSEATGEARAALVRMYASDCVVPPLLKGVSRDQQPKAPFHAYYGEKNKADITAEQGYLPVLNEHGEQVCEPGGGDLLWKLPTAQHDAMLRKVGRESQERMKSAAAGAKVSVKTQVSPDVAMKVLEETDDG